MNILAEWFWDERFWLPVNYTWNDFSPTESIPKAQFSDLHIVPGLAVLILLVRYLFERFVALPLCVIGFGDRLKRKLEENEVCEEVCMRA